MIILPTNSYPNQILLTVRLRSHDAVMLQGGKVLVLDSAGYVAQVVDELPENLPFISGLRASYYLLGRQLDTADGRCGAMGAILDALKARGATQYASEISVEDIEDLRIITRTGVTVLLGGRCVSVTEVTEVSFRSLTDGEILSYIATGDPMDKAGSYGIQSGGALFVDEIHGDYYNVVGLPVCRLHQILKEFME